MDPALRILHVIAPAPSGGAETVVQGLVRGTARLGCRPAVAALVDAPGQHPFVARLRDEGVDVIEVCCGRRRYLAEARAVARVIRSGSWDAIHTHVYHADFVGYRAARATGRPVVSTVHGFTGGELKNRAFEWADRKLLPRFDRVLCVSDGVRTRVLRDGCKPERVRVIPNGHVPSVLRSRRAARRELGLPSDELIVAWIGRLSHEKGPDLFLDALECVPDIPHAAVLVGDGPARAAIAARRGRGRDVRMLGAVPDVASLMTAFDVLVISSRTEGLPMVLLEAMAAGVPVVSFAVGGIPQALPDEAGWLVGGGEPVALGGALRAALKSPAERERRAARARMVLAQRFGMERWSADVLAVYREVVNRPRTPQT